MDRLYNAVVIYKYWGGGPLALQFRNIIGGWDQHSGGRVLMGGLGEMITGEGGGSVVRSEAPPNASIEGRREKDLLKEY